MKMKHVKFSINIDFTDDHGMTEPHTIQVEVRLPETDAVSIDRVEKTLLALNKEAIRQAVVVYFEDLSKKSLREAKRLRRHCPSKFCPVSSRWGNRAI